MQLSVKSRLLLLNLLPAQGNITTIRVVHDLRRALSFSEQEHKELSLRQTTEGVSWDHIKEQPKEIEIGPRALVLIEDTLKDLDKQKKLTEDHIELYELFVKQ